MQCLRASESLLQGVGTQLLWILFPVPFWGRGYVLQDAKGQRMAGRLSNLSSTIKKTSPIWDA